MAINYLLRVFFLCLSIVALSGTALSAQTVNIQVSDIKSSNGQILLAVFKNEESFKSEKPEFRQVFKKSTLKDGKMQLSIELPEGSYGITVVDDENSNGKLDKNMVGIPKEGVAFSNFYLSGMKKPKFGDFSFQLAKPSAQITCKMRYF
ncbi:DUF2141 domain-containing protein [Olivibacter sp. SDN3]|uniref:DUF2141 domain-containing protein n=1 Tax=Olivibacter sp. SDN3 TaxID=2764720 RepID=UPI0016514BCA|nr:DUF2141 domain-containing protein [Olivibacter sp. SDN3]QNL51648.1 DUF2141 domain-containing protein [Olivibacter sp. SDN3]